MHCFCPVPIVENSNNSWMGDELLNLHRVILILRYYLPPLGWKSREIRWGLFSTLLFKEESLWINLILVNVIVFLATICKETICAMAKIPTTCKQKQFLISFITSQAAILIISYCDTPTKNLRELSQPQERFAPKFERNQEKFSFFLGRFNFF